ncbi:uncharacterized protein MYCFIDRAFT_189246 [Pseudocercospora fijiensis CIRAD86]|uniref:O-methyltransferase n=1 Tax=Pseudocercospora fijiensis (strain CIRAD86) TaxID=383855 RepID=M3AUQ2_PSEFD|nr:uncharacterized protein MYCFIDRAFT_189246 [Pseudocercospora fijiensis CIRAD86]EME80878.1 hypothetical protein MYCFIDRAFT_189246 [Pseudocercospora fijiensis CIRAD86]
MLCSLLSLPVDVVRRLDQYSLDSSTGISAALQSHAQWTVENFPDADRASSILQAQWMLQKSRDMGARRVLDIGCYTGLSAMAWYEGTAASRGQIITIEMDEALAAKAQARFQSTGHMDRIRVIHASAEDALQQLIEPFDIIFVDLEFSAYKPIVSKILDRGLLAQGGVILVDNVFARSFAVSSHNTTNLPEPLDLHHWEQAGELVREFNAFVASDPRVEVNVLPIFDGVSEIRLKSDSRQRL